MAKPKITLMIVPFKKFQTRLQVGDAPIGVKVSSDMPEEKMLETMKDIIKLAENWPEEWKR